MNDDYLCIEEVEKTVHVALSPAYAGPKVSGVIEVLEKWKRQYIQQLSGVVVNFKNVSLSSGLGSIMTDQVFIHYDVKATFFIFKPCVGNILRGTINRISKTHVGCVVHDVINVTIDINNDMADNISKYIVLDNVIYFKVTYVDFIRSLIRVKGRITMDCVELLEKYSLTNSNKRIIYDRLQSEEETHPETSVKDNFYSNNSKTSESGDSDEESNSLDVPEKGELQTDGSENIYDLKPKINDSTITSESENDEISHVNENEECTNVNAATATTESDNESSSLTDNEGDIKIKKEFDHKPSIHKHKKKIKLDKSSHKKHKKKSKEKKISHDVSKSKDSNKKVKEKNTLESENNEISQVESESENEECTDVNSAAATTESDNEECTDVNAAATTESDNESSNLIDNEGDIKIKKEFDHTPSIHKHKKKHKVDKSSHKKHKKKSKEKKNSHDVSKPKDSKKKIEENAGSESSTPRKSKKSLTKLDKNIHLSLKKLGKSKKISTNKEENIEDKSFVKSIESPDKKYKKVKESPDKKFKKAKESPDKKIKANESPEKKFKKSKESPVKKLSESPEKKIKKSKDSPVKKLSENPVKLSESPEKKFKKSKESPDKKLIKPSKSPHKKLKKSKSTEIKKSHKKKKKSEDGISPEKKDLNNKKLKKRKRKSSTEDTLDKPSKKIKSEPPD